MDETLSAWLRLDAAGPPELVWLRAVDAPEAVLVLGAFDPPTRAHLALASAASAHTGLPSAFCMTKVLLARPPDALLSPEVRLRLLVSLGAEHGLGVAAANRGTYLEVARAALRAGVEPVFIVGSDKLAQLEDPSFYADGEQGVRATFSEARFLVVPRGAAPVGRADVGVLDPRRVFPDLSLADLSATEVRRRIREGRAVDDLVPPVVALALAGYTRST